MYSASLIRNVRVYFDVSNLLNNEHSYESKSRRDDRIAAIPICCPNCTSRPLETYVGFCRTGILGPKLTFMCHAENDCLEPNLHNVAQITVLPRNFLAEDYCPTCVSPHHSASPTPSPKLIWFEDIARTDSLITSPHCGVAYIRTSTFLSDSEKIRENLSPKQIHSDKHLAR